MKKMSLILLCILLTGCALNTNNKTSGNDISDGYTPIKEHLVENNVPHYDKKDVCSPDDGYFALMAARNGDDIIIYFSDVAGNNVFYQYNISNGSTIQLDISVQGEVCNIDSDNESFYILARKFDGLTDYYYECSTYNYSSQSTQTIRLDETISNGDTSMITDYTVVDGQSFAAALDSIYCFDNTGKVKSFERYDKIWHGLLHTNTGDSILMYSSKDGSCQIQEIDTNFEPIHQYILDSEYNAVYPGFAENEVFILDNTQIYLLDLDTGDKKSYASILLNNLNTTSFIPLSPTSFFTIQNGIPTLWNVGDANNNSQTTILTCATYDASTELQIAATYFNLTHDNIKIDIQDYATYDNGLEQLYVEIAANKAPDLLDLSVISAKQLNSLDYLLNLNQFGLEEKMIPSIYETLKEKEGMFELVPGIKIVALAGSSTYLPSTMSTSDFLTLAENAATEGKYLLPGYITREQFISFILSFSSDSFVNYSTGYCDFENELFANLVLYASTLPPAEDVDSEAYSEEFRSEFSNILEGNQLISIIETGNPVLELLHMKALYGNTTTTAGFPTLNGSGIAMTPFVRLAVTATTPHIDAINTFFDYLLSSEFQMELPGKGYIPVTSSCVDEYINNYISEYKDKPLNLAIPQSEGGFQYLQCPPLDTNIANEVWSLINQIDCINEYDTTIYEIVVKECQPFFADQKELSDVLSSIQGRVTIYLNELQ